eukprot:gnl/TRDRNA2_/TRDRNA2_49784_c0_seq1.p1 gnl/TRDRNA2_/TRDRNA2_49784_c0~~gnl/TRDRNA2_/TRDRNA2_49784_c0_seq1.p1  ORF type:complete len:317 (+),score=62.74 gnl/TRDRNA2_/TRDRNA2_49784_c0_seq1:69-1019(+)
MVIRGALACYFCLALVAECASGTVDQTLTAFIQQKTVVKHGFDKELPHDQTGHHSSLVETNCTLDKPVQELVPLDPVTLYQYLLDLKEGLLELDLKEKNNPFPLQSEQHNLSWPLPYGQKIKVTVPAGQQLPSYPFAGRPAPAFTPDQAKELAKWFITEVQSNPELKKEAAADHDISTLMKELELDPMAGLKYVMNWNVMTFVTKVYMQGMQSMPKDLQQTQWPAPQVTTKHEHHEEEILPQAPEATTEHERHQEEIEHQQEKIEQQQAIEPTEELKHHQEEIEKQHEIPKKSAAPSPHRLALLALAAVAVGADLC